MRGDVGSSTPARVLSSSHSTWRWAGDSVRTATYCSARRSRPYEFGVHGYGIHGRPAAKGTVRQVQHRQRNHRATLITDDDSRHLLHLRQGRPVAHDRGGAAGNSTSW
ncbi:hypothetical protein [Streptomyces sp. 840.1]|uniref:hypothetical protein n=1 Tax=Streptomyces sp. 840.1 TaxID=2485152 RepID=UPI0021A678B3|nr:hypothetical protein [Streptomyces sp. 840.1]